MSTWLLLTLVVLALLATVFSFLIRKLFARVEQNESPADWLTRFSVDTYRPMERLLNEADYRFLARQPGFEPRIARELRAERKKIFRAYLRELIADFHRLLHIANLMLVYSNVDRPDLAKAIFRLRMRFYLTVIQTELSLTLQPLPVRPVNPIALIGALDLMRQNTQQLAVGQALSPANPT